MDRLFRVVSTEQWELALAMGAVPRCPADERRNRVHLNERIDVERVAGLWFSPDEKPLALEIDVVSVADRIEWNLRTEQPIEIWPNLYADNISLAIVVAVYPLEYVGPGQYRLGPSRESTRVVG